jgi:hypothetical protein
MSRKHVISPILITSQTINSDYTSATINCAQTDKASIIIEWSSSTLSGEIKVLVQNGDNADFEILDMGETMTISGSADYARLVFNELPFTAMKIFLDIASGSGTVKANMTLKSAGA